MKWFEPTNVSQDPIHMVSGRYQVSGSDTIVYPGDFVITTTLKNNDTYNTFTGGSAKDPNVFICTAPTAATNKPVYVVDNVNYNTLTDSVHNGNVYREGAFTLGNPCPAGINARLRAMNIINQRITLGYSNFITGSPTVGQYAVLTAGSTVLTGSAAVPASGFTLMVDAQVTPSQGLVPETGYLCHVVQVA